MCEYEVEICPITGRHTVVTTWATCEDAAVFQVCKAFKCPESICKVTKPVKYP